MVRLQGFISNKDSTGDLGDPVEVKMRRPASNEICCLLQHPPRGNDANRQGVPAGPVVRRLGSCQRT